MIAEGTFPVLAAGLVAWSVGWWGVSLARRDASVADPAWGPTFVLVGLLAATRVEGELSDRAWLAMACVAVWGLRLGWHLGRRNLAHGEDRRYAAMRSHHGARFAWVSLFTVFLLQAALAVFVGAPVVAAVQSSAPLGVWDALGVVVFLAGFALEVAGDAQLARFVADPANRGRVLDTGVWGWTRHPNYFGDALLWWGLGAFGVGAGAWWSLFGSALMTWLLRRVSGVTLLEKDIGSRRPGYAEYVRRVPPFVPWPRWGRRSATGA